MAEVLCVGELLVDFLGEGGSSLEEAAVFRPAPGGAPGNAAVAAARVGARVAFVGRVGHDAFGHRLRGALEVAHVDCSALRVDPDAHTTLAFVMPAGRGAHGFQFVRGADARLRPEDVPPELFAGVQAVLCGGVSLSAAPARWATLHAMRVARSVGALCVFDVNYRPALWAGAAEAGTAFREALGLADLLKCNETELDLLSPGEDPVEARVRRLLGGDGGPGPGAAVVTLGHHGAVWVSRAGTVAHAGFEVAAVDAVGAGDCFAGALLAWWAARCRSRPSPGGAAALATVDDEEAASLLAYCNAAAALSTLRPGAMAAMPTGEAVAAFLRERGG